LEPLNKLIVHQATIFCCDVSTINYKNAVIQKTQLQENATINFILDIDWESAIYFSNKTNIKLEDAHKLNEYGLCCSQSNYRKAKL
jgi:hypothetical protein